MLYYPIIKPYLVTIKFSTNNGTLTSSTTTSKNNVYKWRENNGIIERTAANGSTYSSNFFTLNYDSSTASDGLPNYNNSKYLNITKTGYSVVSGKEWKCKSGCTTSGKTYDQSVAYKASDFCDATNKDCTVVLGVNWKVNTYTITYNANGGAGSMGNTVVNYGTNTAIRSNTFTKTGYTFAGWTTRTDGVDDGYNWTGWSGTWKYVDGQYGISNNTLKLYAIWKDTTPPSMDYGPSTGTTWCTGKEVWVSCSDSGSGMKETYMNDNGTVTTGTTYTSQGMSARSGNKKTYLRCTDNAGNVTEKTIWNYYVKDRYCSSTYYCRRAEFGCETYNSRAASPCSCKSYSYSDWERSYSSTYTTDEKGCKAKNHQGDLSKTICSYKQRTCNCGYWTRTKYCSSYNTCRNAAFGCQTYNQGNCGCNSYSCSY